MIATLLRDTLAAAGMSCLLFGLWSCYPPLAWIAGGAATLWLVTLLTGDPPPPPKEGQAK